ncbi:MAG TPA: hypothetical protein PK611_06740 [Saprospiraceae bacterium]|jgi:hypothetical protein|nr:hypothetical protein [Saprospiraceae bacterium]HRO73348.1 hypothetical protein [Saprospiraceae bacterium]HRP42642.1 hypothetical protein [Saprospiraceae bacterium]
MSDNNVFLQLKGYFNINMMEVWERDFEWLRVRHLVKNALKKTALPDFQAVLFLIGVQELGRIPKNKFTKEEKTDLMHIAVCTLLEMKGYYEFLGRDHDGWPHWKELKAFEIKGEKDQEDYLIGLVIEYFKKYNEITPFKSE